MGIGAGYIDIGSGPRVQPPDDALPAFDLLYLIKKDIQRGDGSGHVDD